MLVLGFGTHPSLSSCLGSSSKLQAAPPAQSYIQSNQGTLFHTFLPLHIFSKYTACFPVQESASMFPSPAQISAQCWVLGPCHPRPAPRKPFLMYLTQLLPIPLLSLASKMAMSFSSSQNPRNLLFPSSYLSNTKKKMVLFLECIRELVPCHYLSPVIFLFFFKPPIDLPRPIAAWLFNLHKT